MKTKRTHGRPERADYPTVGAYVEACDEWKSKNPNMHTAEEEKKHLASMAELRKRPERCQIIITAKDYARLGDEVVRSGAWFIQQLANGFMYLTWWKGAKIEAMLERKGIKPAKMSDGSPPPQPLPPKPAPSPFVLKRHESLARTR